MHENDVGHSDLFICKICKYKSVKKRYPCESCKLFQKVDEHLSDVFQNIIIQYYSSYIFELDDNAKNLNNFFGFSSLQDRKQNLNIINKNEELRTKTFYLLMYSHIEAIFYEIENFMKSQNLTFKKNLIIQFKEFIENGKESKDFSFNGRYLNSVEFVRLIANVIKHTSGIINNDRSGKKLIEKYGFSENENIYINDFKKIKNIGKGIILTSIYELGCMAHVYFRDILSALTKTKYYRYQSFNIIKTTHALVNLQLRRSIGKDIIKIAAEEGIGFFSNLDLSRKSNKEINFFIDTKKKIINELYKKKPKEVVSFELYGYTKYNNKKIEFLCFILNNMVNYKPPRSSIKNKIVSSDAIEKTLKYFLTRMIIKYGEKTVMKIFYNDYNNINICVLAKYIKDFYETLSKLKNKDKVIVMKLLSAAPFRRWDPFLFSSNKLER